MHKVTLIRGDGIGPEVVEAAVSVVEAARVAVLWEERLLGECAINAKGTEIPDDTIASIKNNRVALKGPTTTPSGFGHKSANVSLRKALDLFACIRPVCSIDGLLGKFSGVDIIVVRENTEGLYAAPEVMLNDDCAISLRVMTTEGCKRIALKAFKIAEKLNRKKVTLAHKANILKCGDGLFLKHVREIAKNFPKIVYEERLIDSLCMSLVMKPESFDVLLLENMFGDIVSDLCAGLIGGLGLTPGANIGNDCAIFEATHGSAPDIAGLNEANPTAMILSATMMLDHLAEEKAASRIRESLWRTIQEKRFVTRDLGGNAGTLEFTKQVVENL